MQGSTKDRALDRPHNSGGLSSGDTLTCTETIPPVFAATRILRAANQHPFVDLLEQSALIGSFVGDLDAGTIEWSDQLFERYGIDPSQPATLADAFQNVHPEDRPRLAAAVSEGIAAGTGYALDFRVVKPDGRILWNSVRARVHGRKVIGMTFDVTAQKTALETERILREQMTTVLESVSASFIAVDHQWRFTYVNNRVLERLGKSREEVLGKSMWDFVSEETRNAFYPHYQRVMNERVPLRFETSYPAGNGTQCWCDVHAYPTIEGMAALVQDITEQKISALESQRLSHQLEAERTQLRSVVEQLRLIESALKAGTFMFDIATGISHWPPGISSLWGLPAKEHQVALEDFVSRIHPEDRDRVMSVVQKALETRESYHLDFRVIWPDGSLHWLAARGAVQVDDAGNPVRVVGIALESTQQMKTEEALRQSEKLAAAGRLAATIAHEINNPLEAVTNLLYISSHEPLLPSQVREYLDQADQELARVIHIARQTLGFYRESASPENVSLSDAVEQVLALYRKRIASKNLSVRTGLDHHALLRGSKGELRQVVSNIILNAVDAAPPNGSIVIRVSRSNSGEIVFTVADNGSGISKEDRSRIFQPFFTTKRDVGTGLGLWVSKGIVDKHNGRISVRSNTEPGHSGTTFRVVLPSAPAAQAVPA